MGGERKGREGGQDGREKSGTRGEKKERAMRRRYMVHPSELLYDIRESQKVRL